MMGAPKSPGCRDGRKTIICERVTGARKFPVRDCHPAAGRDGWRVPYGKTCAGVTVVPREQVGVSPTLVR
jgi:hypothetical protein